MTRIAGWNCRIVRHVDDGREWHGIHEVFYDEEGRPSSWTEKPVEISAPGGLGELLGYLDDLRRALEVPVLDIRELEAMTAEADCDVGKGGDE